MCGILSVTEKLPKIKDYGVPIIVNIAGKQFAVPIISIERLINLKEFSITNQAEQNLIVVNEAELPLFDTINIFSLGQSTDKQEKNNRTC